MLGRTEMLQRCMEQGYLAYQFTFYHGKSNAINLHISLQIGFGFAMIAKSY